MHTLPMNPHTSLSILLRFAGVGLSLAEAVKLLVTYQQWNNELNNETDALLIGSNLITNFDLKKPTYI